MKNDETVVIIGAGQAGGRAALALRQQGFAGIIHLIGQEPSPPYQRPPLSKAVLLGKKPIEKTQIATTQDYQQKDINLITACSVTSINTASQQVACDDAQQFNYTHLILATGSYPRQLSLPGSELNGITTFRTDQDAIDLAKVLQSGKNLVVIGGGFIGLEIAATASELGCNVTVLETQDRLLSRSMPESASKDITTVHQNAGINILTESSVKQFIGTTQVEAVELNDGQVLKADHVVVGIGIIPDTKLAEQAGVEVNNGIVTDQYGVTSIENIYAIGDCANSYMPRYQQHIRLESSQNADLQAANVATTILAEKQAYNPVPWLWSQQYNWVIQTAGIMQADDEIVKRGDIKDECVVYFALRGNQITAVIGIGKGAAVAKEVRMGQLLIEKNKTVQTQALMDTRVELKNLVLG